MLLNHAAHILFAKAWQSAIDYHQRGRLVLQSAVERISVADHAGCRQRRAAPVRDRLSKPRTEIFTGSNQHSGASGQRKNRRTADAIGLQRNGERKYRTTPRYAGDTNGAVHEFDQAFANRQTQSGAAVFARGRTFGL